MCSFFYVVQPEGQNASASSSSSNYFNINGTRGAQEILVKQSIGEGEQRNDASGSNALVGVGEDKEILGNKESGREKENKQAFGESRGTGGLNSFAEALMAFAAAASTES